MKFSIFSFLSLFCLGLLMIGCQDTNNPIDNNENTHSDTQTTTLTGTFIDSMVEGLGYATETRNGITNSLGQFQYEPNETIYFSIGDIQLTQPPAPREAQYVMTPGDLFSLTQTYPASARTNILQFLQTIDDDNNPDNGITITPAIREAAIGKSIDFNVSTSTFENDGQVQVVVAELTTVRTTGARSLTSRIDAATHFQTSAINKMIELRNEMELMADTYCTQAEQCGAMAIYNGPSCPFSYIGYSVPNTNDLQGIADLVSISYKLGSELDSVKVATEGGLPAPDLCPPGPYIDTDLPVMACISNQCTAAQ